MVDLVDLEHVGIQLLQLYMSNAQLYLYKNGYYYIFTGLFTSYD